MDNEKNDGYYLNKMVADLEFMIEHTKGKTSDEMIEIAKTIKEFNLSFKGLDKLDYGIITSGGICVKEIDPKTMESKLCKGLYFAGEVIDVDAYTGGFNLQIAFSTGRLAGECSSQ